MKELMFSDKKADTDIDYKIQLRGKLYEQKNNLFCLELDILQHDFYKTVLNYKQREDVEYIFTTLVGNYNKVHCEIEWLDSTYSKNDKCYLYEIQNSISADIGGLIHPDKLKEFLLRGVEIIIDCASNETIINDVNNYFYKKISSLDPSYLQKKKRDYCQR